MAIIHLSSATSSLVLGVALPHPSEDAAGQRLPEVLHWGAPLTDADAADLEALAGRATPHSNPDVPTRRPYLPLPVDGWQLRPALSGARLDGTGFSPRFTLAAAPAQDPAGSVALTAVDEAAGLRLDTAYGMDEHGVVTIAQTLTNTGDTPYAVAGLLASLPVPDRAREIVDLTGRWCLERQPQRHPLPMGSWVRESRHGRTGHDGTTVLHVGVPGFGFGRGEVWGLHLAWSGDATYAAERSPSAYAQVVAGELLVPGEVVLAPGESYAAPLAYAAYTRDGGMDAVAGAFHAHLRGRASHPSRPRPVLLNTWEAVYFDHDLARLTALADAAAEVGVERFVLDDGWFGSRRDDRSGLGDWVVSADVWPQGLAPLVEHVTGLGMEFGIWVEPEMINRDSDLARAHPEWVLAVPGREPMAWRHQQVLDLAEPGAYAHVLGQLDALLRDHDIAYVKWDMNRDLIEAARLGRAAVHAQTLAVYRLLDELRARHPGVEIESCASGGGRVDLAVLERTDRVWASDNIDAHDRQQILPWTAALLPPELVGTHIGSGAAHATGRRLSLAFRAASALFGHLGIEADLTRSDEAERAAIAEVVATHQRLRPLLHSGRVVRCDDLDAAGAVAHGVVAADGSAAIFSYAQVQSSPTEVPAPWRLRGLDPSARYRVTPLLLAGGPSTQQIAGPAWLDAATGAASGSAGEGVAVSGAALMAVGLALPVLHPDQALLVELNRV